MSTITDIKTVSNLAAVELELIWRTQLGGTMPRHLPKFVLARFLAYRLQAQQGDGLSKSAKRFLVQIANDVDAGREPAMPYPNDHSLKPGCVIVREHDGIHHRVMVLENGFAWNGKTFASLSSVAKAITGTNWNGQRFFSLKGKKQMVDEVST
jgi:hypothetical protein